MGQLCFITSMKSSLSVPGPPITRSVSLQAPGQHSSGYWLCLVVNGPIVGGPVPTTERLFQNSLARSSQPVHHRGQWGHVQGPEPYECKHHVTTCQAESPTWSSRRPGPERDVGQTVTNEVTVNVGSWGGPGPGFGHCQPTHIIVQPLDPASAPGGHPVSFSVCLLSSLPRNSFHKSTFSASSWDKASVLQTPSPHPSHRRVSGDSVTLRSIVTRRVLAPPPMK